MGTDCVCLLSIDAFVLESRHIDISMCKSIAFFYVLVKFSELPYNTKTHFA